jgi:hypothetical protein
MGGNLQNAITAAFQAAENLLEAGANVSTSLLNLLSSGAPGALGDVANWVANAGPGRDCACHIPPPCWMPRILREVKSLGIVGDEASLTFTITNESMVSRTIQIFTTTPMTGLSPTSTTLTLAAMARGEVTVTYTIPTGTTADPGTEILLWIRGCRLHFLRWVVKLGTVSTDTDQEVHVKDGPENLHHWYDHFYCAHPCLEQQPPPRGVGNTR